MVACKKVNSEGFVFNITRRSNVVIRKFCLSIGLNELAIFMVTACLSMTRDFLHRARKHCIDYADNQIHVYPAGTIPYIQTVLEVVT